MDYFKTAQTTRHLPEDMNLPRWSGGSHPPLSPSQCLQFPRERRAGLWKVRWGPEGQFVELYLEDGSLGCL